MSGCVVIPSRLSIHERRLWIHQNKIRTPYYKKYPNKQERYRRDRIYVPYFRLGRY